MRFKIINDWKIRVTKFPSDLDSFRDGEFSYEVENDYIERVWFESELSIEQIEYHYFYLRHRNINYADHYINPESMHEYFVENYGIPFFYEFVENDLKERYRSDAITEILDFKIFIDIIKPNLKINIVKQINETDLEQGFFYVFHNFEFYTELQYLEPHFKTNSILRDLSYIPVETRNYYKSKIEAEMRSFYFLLYCASAGFEKHLKGLDIKLNTIDSLFLLRKTLFLENQPKIDIEMFKRMKDLVDPDNIYNIEDFLNQENDVWLYPTEAVFELTMMFSYYRTSDNESFDDLLLNNYNNLYHEYKKCMTLFRDNNLLPFTIVQNNKIEVL